MFRARKEVGLRFLESDGSDPYWFIVVTSWINLLPVFDYASWEGLLVDRVGVILGHISFFRVPISEFCQCADRLVIP